MEYRRLGRTGLKVSSICLGTMQFGWTADEATSFQIMDKSVALGCNFFDTAVSSAIIGANTLDQLIDTMKGAEISLTAEEKATLDQTTVWQ